jgi:SecY
MTSSIPNTAFRPIAVTLAALIAYRLGTYIPLPGLNLDYLGQTGIGGAIGPEALGRLSVLALGILPWFSVLTLFELAAIALPVRWTRQFMSSGHAQPFARTVIILTVLLTALQGYGVVEAMTHMPNMVAIATLVGGTAILIALALIIEHKGVGHGFWIMLAASILAQMPSHFRIMLLMLTEGMASPAATLIAVASTVAIIALVVCLLEARRHANVADMSILIWPLVLASLASGFIVAIGSLILPEGSDDKLDTLATMLTNRPAGFVIGGVIASALAATYASRENDWRFFPPAVAVIAAVQLQSIVAEAMTVQPPLAGASLVIVTVVGYVVLMRVGDMKQGT